MIFLCSFISCFSSLFVKLRTNLICGRDKGGFSVFPNSFYVMRPSRLLLYRPCTVCAERWPNVLNMPLELLFETSLARAMKNLETYRSQGLLLANFVGGVPPERTRKSVFFQPVVFRPGL